jgi:hypothetical protein
MATFYNSQVTQDQVSNDNTNYKGVDCNLGDATAKILFNTIPNWSTSLSGTGAAQAFISLTYANTGNTLVEGISSGTGDIYVDGAYKCITAVGTPLFTAASGISGVNVTNGGLGYWGPGNDGAVTVTFSSPQSGSNVATGTVVYGDGNITGVTITNQGSGYNTTGAGAATATFSAPATHKLVLQMRDYSCFEFDLPRNGNRATPQTVSLTAVGYGAVGPDKVRKYLLGY